MRFRSTRGASPEVDFETAILTGLAPDSGLYLPVEWPSFSNATLASWTDLSYQEVAARVIEPFAEGFVDLDELESLLAAAYEGFGNREIAPIVDLGDLHVMELFWGPTLAFKDFGLQMLASMVDVALQRHDRRATVVGATSGDTGSAAIEAFRDRDQVDVVILYPHGRVSEVQRRQMTTVQSQNVHAVAVDGTFDDCQDLLKRLLADQTARQAFSLTTTNSINFGRLAPQIAYYIWAVLKVGRGVSFAVPSGNFGNVFSG
ncbi:MAG TPA: threonine synthase, partial [Actinobacteria bacterium]|nr:threonine synthase [Actinomycetota bacterium]